MNFLFNQIENAHILEAAKKLWGSLNHCEY